MSKCLFVEEDHKYFLIDENGVETKELISVTTLMRKHGLAPDYGGVPSETLQAKAEYGKLIHKELEDYITQGEIGFSSELTDFINYIDVHDFYPKDSELLVYDDFVAGTIDLTGFDPAHGFILADFKTTATLHKEAVSWQLSIYAYLFEKQFDTQIDGLQAFHFSNGLKVVDIERKPVEEIEKLLDAEKNGEIYEQKQLVVAGELVEQLADAEATIKHFELQKKEAEANAEQLRQALLEAMRAQGVKSFENARLKITYVAPTTRETIDDAKLKKELPEIAEQYKKISKVKDSVRITLK